MSRSRLISSVGRGVKRELYKDKFADLMIDSTVSGLEVAVDNAVWMEIFQAGGDVLKYIENLFGDKFTGCRRISSC